VAIRAINARCVLVLIDLKLDKLTHQDLGQMQMYVHYYDREVKLAEENATIGLLHCQSNLLVSRRQGQA